MNAGLNSLGIDCGSAALKIVVVDPDLRVLHSFYAFHKGKPLELIRDFLETSPHGPFGDVAATAGTPAAVHADYRAENNICFIEGVRHVHPGVRNIVVVGAEKFARIIFDQDGSYRKMRSNSTCAAGTGSFLDQQAVRLGIESAELLAELAERSGPELPRIASRCSVFAKTDLIHAQQEGWSTAAISDGLCAGLARNIADTLFPGETLEGPTVMAGGVALNRRVVHHLTRFARCEILCDPLAPYYGALGALIRSRAAENRVLRDEGMVRQPRSSTDILVTVEESRRYGHGPLASPRGSYPDFRSLESWSYNSPVLGPGNPAEVDLYLPLDGASAIKVHLGIDIGSTSTKAAVLDTGGRVLVGIYLRTAGDPIKAVQGLLDTLRDMEERAGVRFDFAGCATTGSGRKLVGAVVGADGVIDEISAHARAAVALDSQVDTIIEIGGQDSKFTALADGVVVFSQMNTVCAAGTGSFIEEQAMKLGVPIQEYAERALGRSSPAGSDRCTVFMERDLNNYQNEGYGVDELLAATLFSVCDNYLSKVAAEGSIGNRIVFQGATAKNKALVAAFEQRLGKPIAVSPYCHITGAIGAVLQTLEDRVATVGSGTGADQGPSRFKGLALARETIAQRSDVCDGCPNHCKLHIIRVQGEDIVYGYLCGRGAGDKTFVSKNSSGFDLLRERRSLLEQSVRHIAERVEEQEAEAADAGLGGRLSRAMVSLSTSTIDRFTDALHQATDSALEASRRREGGAAPERRSLRIGIPRCLYLQEDWRLWRFFFEALGFAVVPGQDSSRMTAEGKRIAGADFCAPVAMLHGQVRDLLEKCDYVFLPVYLEAPAKAAGVADAATERGFYCNYSQYAPTLVAVATDGAERVLRPLIYSSFGNDAEAVHELREMLRSLRLDAPLPPPSVLDRFFRDMKRVKAVYDGRLKELYAKVRPEEDEMAVVLTGRPYTALAAGLNKGIPDLFAQHGLKVFFHDMLPHRERHDRELQAYHWYYAAKVIETALHCAEDLKLYPVLVTSFKCGPDSFAMDTFKEILDRARKPYLILQIDEHDSAVGYETRVEAAVRAFRNHFRSGPEAGRSAAAQGAKAAVPGIPLSLDTAARGGSFALPKLPFTLPWVTNGAADASGEAPRRAGFPRAKTVLLPAWDDLVCRLLAAALRGNGVDAHVLEERPEYIREAMTYNSGQCIPVSVVAHEAARFIGANNLAPERTALWMIKALWPCNIPLYPLQMESILKKAGGGLDQVEVYSGDLTFFDVSPRMTLDAYYAFALGGLLRKVACRLRPYETEAGAVDALVGRILEDCVLALEKRRPMVPVIRKLAVELERIPRKRTARPKVAIFGDFYVRDNDVFNQDLIRSIERSGGEVVVTSYVEYLKATAEAFFDRLLLEKRFAGWMGYRTVMAAVAAVERSLERKTGMALSDGPWTNRKRRIAFDYFGFRPEMSGENLDNALKILKILDEYPDLSLFVQAAPAFCCPSLVTEAMTKAIEAVTGVPVLSITYDGTGAYKNDLVAPYLARYGNTSTGGGAAPAGSGPAAKAAARAERSEAARSFR